MRWLLRCALILLAAATAAPAFQSAASASEPLAAAVSAETFESPRRLMVMLRLGAEHFQAGSDYGDYGPGISEKGRLRLARSIARRHGLKVIETWPMQRIGVDCVIMDIPDGRSVDAVTAELAAERGVAWSQPLNEFEFSGG